MLTVVVVGGAAAAAGAVGAVGAVGAAAAAGTVDGAAVAAVAAAVAAAGVVAEIVGESEARDAGFWRSPVEGIDGENLGPGPGMATVDPASC